jgi:hypothetical protein
VSAPYTWLGVIAPEWAPNQLHLMTCIEGSNTSCYTTPEHLAEFGIVTKAQYDEALAQIADLQRQLGEARRGQRLRLKSKKET